MDPAGKRSRAPNWDNTEKALLKELVKDDLKVIETKMTDTNTNKSKTKAWQKIHNRFQELNARERTLAELKQQWRCMKLEAKKSISVHRQAVRETGGGPKPPSPSTDAVEILEMIPLEFEVDHNQYDSDYLLQSTGTTQDAGSWREALDPPSMCVQPDLPYELQGPSTSIQTNLSSEVQDVSLLPVPHKPSSSKKGKGKRTQLFEDNQTKAIQSLAEERSRVLLQQQEAEHQQRMANLQREMEMKITEHQKIMRCIQEDHDRKKEEHQVNMEVLLLKKKKLLLCLRD